VTGPPSKQPIPISALPIAVLVLLLVAGTIAVLSFALSKMQAPQEAQEPGIDTNAAVTCKAACRDCFSQDYDARCFDRCRFGFKPYCD
jgi:hypothetical protein